MSSRESEPWRRYGSRDSRQGDDTDNRWRDRGRRDSDMSRDSYHRYGGEAHTSMKRDRGNWGGDDHPESSYSREPYQRDWRRSPDRRNNYFNITPDKDTALEREYAKLKEEDQELLRKKKELEVIEEHIAHKKAALVEKLVPAKSKPSQKHSISEKKHCKFTEDLEDFYSRPPTENFAYSQSPHGRHRQRSDDYMYRQPHKEFKHRPTDEEGFKYRPPHKEFKHRPTDEEDFKYRPPHKEFKHRPTDEEDFKYRPPHKEFKHGHTDEEDFKYTPPHKEFKHRPTDEEDFKYRPPHKEFKHRHTDEEDFKYRPPHKEFKHRPTDEEDFTYRQPPKEFKPRHTEEDFNYRQPPSEYKPRHTEEHDFKYSQTPREFKHRLPEDDFQYRKTPRYSENSQRSDSLTYRHTPEFQKGGQFKSSNNDNLKEQSHDFLSKLMKPRERSEHHNLHSEEFHQIRREGLMNEVRRQSDGQVSEAEQDVTHQRADEQNTADKGFQRFLNVLNKGVDMSRLANIVCRASTEGGGTLKQDHVNYVTGDGRPELSSEKGSPVGFQGHTQFYENNFPKKNVGSSDFSSSSRSRSPLVVEKTKVRPEDDQKCRHMQDVLQAIGMDLGLEELGLMSNRIQERLYGKRDSEKKESDKDRGKEARRVYSPRHHSRSSSSDSSDFNHVSPHFPLKKDLKETQRVIHDPKDRTQTFNHHYTGDRDTDESVQNTDQGANMSQQSTFSHYSTYGHPPYSMPQCQTAPVMPTYPAGQYPSCTWPVLNHAFAPTWGISVGPMPLLPCPPVFPPGPSVPPLNTYLSTSSPRTTNHQPTTNRQLTYVTLQDTTPVQPVNLEQGQNPVQPVSTSQNHNPVQPVSTAQNQNPVQPVSTAQNHNPVQPVSTAQNQSPPRPVATTQSQTLTRPRCLQVIKRDKRQQTKKMAEESEKKKTVNTVQPKRTLSMPAKIKNMSDLKYRRWLFYSGRLKAIHQRQQKQAQFNSTTEKSIVNLIQLARLKAASKSAAKSHGKVLGDRKKAKSTIKLRLLVDEVIVKPSGSTECPEMPCEPDNTTETCDVDG